MAGYLGHPQVKTPHLDRLAADSTVFSNAYCNSPLCTPSRASFITGKYPHQMGSWAILVPFDPAHGTWPRRLEDAGIPTTAHGKLHLCGPHGDGGFGTYREIYAEPAWQPYPRSTPFEDRLRGHVRHDKRDAIDQSGPRDASAGSHTGRDPLWVYDHDRQVTRWSVDFIDERAAEPSDTPWVLYVGFLLPHWPFAIPERFFEMYQPESVDVPVDARFPNEDLHPALRRFQATHGTDGITDDDVRRTIATYYGMVTAMDENVGAITDALRRGGLYDDTVIIYTSDHGESLAEHGLFFKECSYEGSVGVPLIVKGATGTTGGHRADPVSLVDMYPTILDVHALEPEPDRPGSSWLRARDPEHDYVLSEFHGNLFTDSWYMVRSGRLKYTWYEGEPPTLYDLENDPGEFVDLAGDPAHADDLRHLDGILRRVLDPEEVALRSKRDLGLIGPDGEDYTRTLTAEGLRAGRETGQFLPEPAYGELAWAGDSKNG
jgi:choline-sulfatase